MAAADFSTVSTVSLSLRDNGTGIPTEAEAKEKISNPFFTTKPAGEGTGLGLPVSHDIIGKQHGGKIEVGGELAKSSLAAFTRSIAGPGFSSHREFARRFSEVVS